ncbi:hypothetical protein RFI_15732 [Reticulomyxa filosa]|uniref:Uncharacterized protein n=1 Tax=Reticulomyxa filosa TaxID=46433 RepID=X6N6W0_RETFI|nr:hypothetical protein RFI_15732 [Reticulomyxa filosa]|eukprot:ETO21474.1 hypothetical protein RFI_15732 [Reticulomyxa filosa]
MTIDDIKAKIFNMGCKEVLLACTLSNRHLRWYDIRNPRQQNDVESAFQTQLRGLDCFPNGAGFAVGSVEGRIQVRYINKKMQDEKGFSFKCHRQDATDKNYSYNNTSTHVYSVNALRFHQEMGTLASGGSDGEISIWDKDGRLFIYFMWCRLLLFINNNRFFYFI